jgi:hypothetical protein
VRQRVWSQRHVPEHHDRPAGSTPPASSAVTVWHSCLLARESAMKKILVGVAVIAAGLTSVVGSVQASPKRAEVSTPTRYLGPSGGTVRFSARVKNAQTCRWSSSGTMRAAGFDGTLKCKAGRVTRLARFKANPSLGVLPQSRFALLTLTVKGKTGKTVYYLNVEEAAFRCSGTVSLTGRVSGVSGSFPNYVTSVSGTVTNDRSVRIYDVRVTIVLAGSPQTAEANMIVVDIPGSIAQGATVSWSASGPPVPYPEVFLQNPWVSNYANNAKGVNCGVDGIGSN